jgi:hypothetical protein
MPAEQLKSVVLVTGGTGLVGSAIQHVIDTEPLGSRFGRRENETWVFLSSKDADLRFVLSVFSLFAHPFLTFLALPLQGYRADEKDLQ